MKNSTILSTCGAFMALQGVLPLQCVAATDVAERSDNRPNVIYIFPDQMRNAAMGFWSQEDYSKYINFQGDPVVTPNLNKFAGEGVVLTHAMSNCPVSSPHRGSLLSGMFPSETGVPINCHSNRPYSSLRTDIDCIGDVFSKAGYSCGYIGKYHVDAPTKNDPANPGNYVEKKKIVWDAYTPKDHRHGFDFWYSYGTFNAHKSPHYWDNEGKRHNIKEWSPMYESDVAISYLRNDKGQRDSSKPFLMMVAFNPPHTPFNSLNDCMEEDYNNYKDIPYPKLLVRPNVNKEMAKAAKAPFYFSSVTGIDRAFGKIMKALKESGLDKNTIVIFSSDHGEMLCSHNTNESKNMPYSESMNVPFIVRYPGKIKPHVDSEFLLSTPDVMPSILGMCGMADKIPSNVQGLNFANRFMQKKGGPAIRKGALYLRNTDGEKGANGFASTYFPESRGVKTLDYTLVFTINKSDNSLKEVLLFDDNKDPYQMNNLPWKENMKIVKQLTPLLSDLLKEANDPWVSRKILSDIIPY